MAEKLERLDNGHWLMTTDQGQAIEAPVIVIAAGGGSFVPKRPPIAGIDAYERSEEHTSKLQSLMRISYPVFCLKKNNKHRTKTTYKKLLLLRTSTISTN